MLNAFCMRIKSRIIQPFIKYENIMPKKVTNVTLMNDIMNKIGIEVNGGSILQERNFSILINNPLNSFWLAKSINSEKMKYIFLKGLLHPTFLKGILFLVFFFF